MFLQPSQCHSKSEVLLLINLLKYQEKEWAIKFQLTVEISYRIIEQSSISLFDVASAGDMPFHLLPQQCKHYFCPHIMHRC